MNLLRFIPAGIGPRLAVWGFVFSLGLYFGNSWATERWINQREQAGAVTMAKNHNEMIVFYAGKMKELRLAREQLAEADAAAYAAMAKSKEDTARALALTRAQLKTLETAQQNKLAEVRDDVKALPPTPGCVLPPSVRQSLNAAIDSLNNRPDVGFAEAPPTRLPDGTSSAVAPVTCAELVGSVTDILEHDAMLTAWVLSWQRWAYEALR
jgi:hypothetical protein